MVNQFFSNSISDYWKVLSLFIIPFGGGIPAGVLMAKSLNVAWPITTILYFISDVLLALVFEPILMIFIHYSKKNEKLLRIGLAMKEAINKTTEHYGTASGPLALIIVAFGVDPMTGRTVAVAAGHGFITGWMIAIAGDMLYFGVIMASTLWLNNIIGDNGVATTLIILVLMMVVPGIIKKFKTRNGSR